MARRGPRLVLRLVACAAVALVQTAAAQIISPSDFAPLDGQDGQGALPNRLSGEVGIDEHLGARVPTDLAFLDEGGRRVRLADLVDGERPLVVSFVYHDCPMLCSLTLDGLSDGIAATDLTLGEDYRVLAVSMDPDDTPDLAREAKARYARQIGDADPAAFHFWTIAPDHPESTETLADAVGFRYAYDVRTGEYAHGAALVFLSPKGVVTRYLYGIDPAPFDMKMAALEAGEGTITSSVDRFLLTCFEYDEDARSYSLQILTATKIGGGLLLLIAGGALFALWRREVRSTPAGWETPPDPHPAH